MTKQETLKLITFLAGNYDSILNKTEIQKKAMVATWYECLKDLDFKLVTEATKILITKSPYVPTIAEIRKTALEVTSTEKKTPIELWNRAYKLIGRASRVTEEEFKQEPIEIQRFFGRVDILQRYGAQQELNLDVLRSNFLKQCEMIQDNIQEQRLVPAETQQRLNELSQKFLLNKGD